MKKTTKSFAIAVIALIFSACKQDATPKSIAESFLTTLSAGDFTKAKTMVTKDSEEAIESLKTFAADQVKGKKYTVTKEDIQGDNATVTYKQEGKEGEKTMKLMKVEGNWKIMFDKNEFTGSLDELTKSIEGLDGLGDSLTAAFNEEDTMSVAK